LPENLEILFDLAHQDYASSDTDILNFLHCHAQYGQRVACTLPAVDATVTSKSGQGEPAIHAKPQHNTSHHIGY